MYKRAILYHDEMGVYLGSFWGMGFWSKLDPIGQDSAAVFESLEEIKKFMETWEKKVPNCTIYMLETENPNYATVKEIEAIGLPGWNWFDFGELSVTG